MNLPGPYRNDAVAATSLEERAVAFECSGDLLQGVLTLATQTPALSVRLGVVVVVGGPQYRVGSHRQFVLLARALANAGFAVLRFDQRGMGDSGGEARNFESVSDDIAAAVNTLVQHVAAIDRVVLWGLCDGASAALLYWHERRDPRVSGLCLLNPWIRSENSLARVHVKHYYRKRLMQREFWLKLLRGRVAAAAFSGFTRNLKASIQDSGSAGTSFRDRMAAAWRAFDGDILLLLSENDLTAREFLDHVLQSGAWQGALHKPRLQRHDLTGADHTLSSIAQRLTAERLMIDWMCQLAAVRHA